MSVDHRVYWVVVQPVPKESGGGFIARVPSLPGCFTQGETLEEVEENIRDLVPLWLTQMQADGGTPPPSDADENMPVPRIRPIIAHSAQGEDTAQRGEENEFLTTVAV